MKVYKNPWVTRESYFVKTGASSGAGYSSFVYGYYESLQESLGNS
nr:MAG TPA: hypothetical protein [Caudoviricetes sp.]